MPSLTLAYVGRTYTINYHPNDREKDLRFMIREIFTDQVYTSLSCPISPGDVIIDGGAHIGLFTLYALAHDASRIIAVEPSKRNVEQLRLNVPLEATIVRSALWGCERGKGNKLKFTQRYRSAGCHVSADGYFYNKYVSGITIDSLVDTYGIAPDFVKLDIEGSELQALLGGHDTIRKYRPKLAIALYHKPEDIVDIPKFIHNLDVGYGEPEITGVTDERGFRYITGLWSRPNV